ncbi:MAG TPA: hypothetical protein VHA14_03410 [Bryobacteraceae bacterium]|nr:hypothetical protein [Bryobacteraceae bacterium]
MKKLISVLVLGGFLAMTPAFAAQSKAPKVHPAHQSKAAKRQAKLLKKEQAKARKQAKSRAKTRNRKSA